MVCPFDTSRTMRWLPFAVKQRRFKALLYTASVALVLTGAAQAQEAEPEGQPTPEPQERQATLPPEGLNCPEVEAGELISVSLQSPVAGVLGYCIYQAIGETDFEAATLNIALANQDYDPVASFRAPKIENGWTQDVEDAARSVSLGDGEAEAAVVILRIEEEDLGDITESFAGLWVVDVGEGRRLVLEEDYNNVSAFLSEPLRAAVLAAQDAAN